MNRNITGTDLLIDGGVIASIRTGEYKKMNATNNITPFVFIITTLYVAVLSDNVIIFVGQASVHLPHFRQSGSR